MSAQLRKISIQKMKWKINKNKFITAKRHSTILTYLAFHIQPTLFHSRKCPTCCRCNKSIEVRTACTSHTVAIRPNIFQTSWRKTTSKSIAQICRKPLKRFSPENTFFVWIQWNVVASISRSRYSQWIFIKTLLRRLFLWIVVRAQVQYERALMIRRKFNFNVDFLRKKTNAVFVVSLFSIELKFTYASRWMEC